jgi:urease accessory protein
VTPALMRLLHLCDSLFPIGGFSHSDGLEAATDAGEIAAPDHFAAWLAAIRDHSLRSFEGPAVARAWTLSREARCHDLEQLDAEVHALRPAAAARDASRAMGARLVNTWRQIYPEPQPQAWPAALTLPVAFGCVGASAGVAQRDLVGAYIYTRMAAALSAAMRLMPLGQHQGHTLLAAALAPVDALVDAIVQDHAPLSAFTPALDITSMRHQFVHSRLFRS